MPVPLPKNAVLKYQGPLINAYEHEQRLYDGSHTLFQTIVRPDTVTVLAFVDTQTVLMTHQEQPHKATAFWALPGGRVDHPETHREAIARELAEETGLRADTVEHWYTKTWSGLICYEEVLFVAKGLSPAPHGSHLDPGERIELMHMPWQDLIALCFQQQLRGSTISSLILTMEFDPATKARLQKFLAD